MRRRARRCRPRPVAGRSGAGSRPQSVRLGGGQQLVALAVPLGGEQRIAADDEPFAGEFVAVTSARSRSSNSDGVTVPAATSLRMVGARSVVIQRSPSTLARSSRIRAAAGRRARPAGGRSGSEVDLTGHGQRVAGRTSTATGQPLAVHSPKTSAACPSCGRGCARGVRARSAFPPRSWRSVVEPGCGRWLGESLFDGRLPLDEPVHGGVQLERVDLAEIQQVPPWSGALGGQGAGGGSFDCASMTRATMRATTRSRTRLVAGEEGMQSEALERAAQRRRARGGGCGRR